MSYIKGLSERIRDIFKKIGVQVYFKGDNTLRSILVSPKDKEHKLCKQDVSSVVCGFRQCFCGGGVASCIMTSRHAL